LKTTISGGLSIRSWQAMNVEAQVTWTDGERFVANASSGHANCD
jgi:hypothetical protein